MTRYSLRAKISGEVGPTLIVKPKTHDTRTTFVPPPPAQPRITEDKDRPTVPEGTCIESYTMLEKMGYVQKWPIESQEMQYANQTSHNQEILKPATPRIAENLEEMFSGEIPTAPLPGDGDRVFLVSGITQGILGQGGIGRVYKILLKHLEVVRALKILQPAGVSSDPEQWKRFCVRFMREIKILSNLHHTHIAQIHGFGEWENYPFIEMEYVPGSDLKTLITSSGHVPLAATTAVAIQVARALTHAHNKTYMLDGQQRRGLIHRDMKPQNVIVSRDGESKLLDFGVALPMGMVTQTIFHRGTAPDRYRVS